MTEPLIFKPIYDSNISFTDWFDSLTLSSDRSTFVLSKYRKQLYGPLLRSQPIKKYKFYKNRILLYFPNERIQCGWHLLEAITRLLDGVSTSVGIHNKTALAAIIHHRDEMR